MKYLTNMKEMIKEKAHNKAFAKIHALQIRVSRLKYDIERKNTGVVTMHELEICLDAATRELKTWNYIFKLIELDYGKHDYANEILGSRGNYDA
jgi:hypothetical protein